MSIPLFFPVITFVERLPRGAAISLRELCQRAGVECRASGPWTKRSVQIVRAARLQIIAEPGTWGGVRIGVPYADRTSQARLALGAMAYAMHDLVAKQSILGQDWAKISVPRGRPRKMRAMSNKERQRKFRLSRGE